MISKKPMQNLGLLITYEGLSQIVESQLIEHADFLNNQGYLNQVWVLCGTKKIYKYSLKLLDEIQSRHITKIILIESFSHNLPFSPLFNSILILKKIKEIGILPLWIHARTEYTAATALFLRKILKFKLIYDVRGDTYSEIIEGTAYKHPATRILHFAKALLTKRRHYKSINQADHTIFISDALKKINEKYIKKTGQTTVIPCLVNSNLFYFNKSIRDKIRNKLGYKEDQIILCYLGSTSHYQCIDETIHLMILLLNSNSLFKALIISKEPSFFIEKIPNNLFNRFDIISIHHHEVNNYLNAIDYAFLIRKHHLLNWVSSPIKFAEYSMTGLQVITTDAVSQITENNNILQNCIFLPEEKSNYTLSISDLCLEKRKTKASLAKKIYSRNTYLKEIKYIYKTDAS